MFRQPDFQRRIFTLFVHPTLERIQGCALLLSFPTKLQVLFAGEACSLCYFQCVDGAFDTGTRAAECVVKEGLQKRSYGPGLDPIPEYATICGLGIVFLCSDLVGYYLTDLSELSDEEDSDIDEQAKENRMQTILETKVDQLVSGSVKPDL